MPKKHRIVYAPAAVDDLDEIFSYISQDNISAAEMLLEKINQKISRLAEFPNIGSVLSDEDFFIIKRGYRFIVVHPYIVFYTVIDNAVFIYRILHGRRDYLRQLFE